MTILTIGTLVRSFASLIMSDSMSTRDKQVSVLSIAVILFVGFQLTHSTVTIASTFDALLDGLTAGLTALGVYHLTDTPVDKTVDTTNLG